jgi:hypothetical protein
MPALEKALVVALVVTAVAARGRARPASVGEETPPPRSLCVRGVKETGGHLLVGQSLTKGRVSAPLDGTEMGRTAAAAAVGGPPGLEPPEPGGFSANTRSVIL